MRQLTEAQLVEISGDVATGAGDGAVEGVDEPVLSLGGVVRREPKEDEDSKLGGEEEASAAEAAATGRTQRAACRCPPRAEPCSVAPRDRHAPLLLPAAVTSLAPSCCSHGRARRLRRLRLPNPRAPDVGGRASLLGQPARKSGRSARADDRKNALRPALRPAVLSHPRGRAASFRRTGGRRMVRGLWIQWSRCRIWQQEGECGAGRRRGEETAGWRRR
ncbi:unnamed protein product [Urochloa humidicola]